MSDTPTTLVILGASGDLTHRLLLPGLGTLLAREPQRQVAVWGCAVDEMDTAAWQQVVHSALTEGGCAADTADRIATASPYRTMDVTSEADLDALLAALPDKDDTVLYFALPPAITEQVCRLLSTRQLGGLRLALEKPFGTDLESARALNQLLASFRTEEQIFRVDHFLGSSQVLNLLGLRFANRLFEPVWRGEQIERIDIVADETLALEGRARYYDKAGALVDMLQSHLLLVMALTTIEEPASIDAVELRDLMAHVLRATEIAGDDPVASSRRARYTAGTVGTEQVPSYVDEQGVDPTRNTETLAEIDVEIRNGRWAGVPVRLRSGKALGIARRQIVVTFRPVPHVPHGLTGHAAQNVITIDLNPERLDVLVATNGEGDSFDLEETHLHAELGGSDIRPYGEILQCLLDGDALLSVRGDVAQECWRICTPILQAWRDGRVPMQEYAAGSAGPSDRSEPSASSATV